MKAVINIEFLTLFLYDNEIIHDSVDVDYDCLTKFNVGDEVEILKEIEKGLFSEDQKSYVIYNPKTHESITIAEIFLDIKREPKLITTWEELKQCESDTHYLEIEEHSGWIHSKNSDEYHYLSTHTFYGKTHEGSTKLLQSCGFNVQLANWDEL